MSVFALRPRELRHAPIAGMETAHLTREDFGRVLIACVVALILSGALVFFLLELPASQPNGPAAPSIVKPPWVDIQKPFRLFALNAPEWGREPVYTAERHRSGGGRRDQLSFGTFGAGAWLQMTLYRPGAEDPDPAPFFVDMARRAARTGLAVARMGQQKALPTRLGSFEVADLTLAAASAPASLIPCLGFRLTDARILQIGGFACGTPGRPIERDRLACTLDRIDLISAGDDTEVRAFFIGAKGQLGAACSNPPKDMPEPSKPAGFVVLR
ncbi:MAG: hypothetical protein JOZ16_08775 [Methylobacteriaceae bacterium]|nr:hypothetical protein [Methylobacteriaceae bacterium]